jgi:hypothetical protein
VSLVERGLSFGGKALEAVTVDRLRTRGEDVAWGLSPDDLIRRAVGLEDLP